MTINAALVLFMNSVMFVAIAAAGQVASTPADSAASQFQASQGFNPFGALIQSLGLLVALGLILYLALRFVKGTVYGKGFNARSEQIKVLGSSFIGPRKSICMVKVLDHLLVLALTENQVTVLLRTPLTELNEATRQSLLAAEAKPDMGRGFKKILSDLTSK